MLDLLSEPPLSLKEAARRVRPSRPVSIPTIVRWVTSGVRGTKLESALLGGRRVTTEAALGRFLKRLNGDAVAPSPAPDRAAAAERELIARGC